MYYSQFGEDRILASLFADRDRGCCVEVGANDGYHGSTTLYFEKLGWDCVLIEPNPALCDILRRDRSAKVFQCAASSTTGTATLQMAIGEGLAHAVSTICEGPDAERELRKHGFDLRPVSVDIRRLDDIFVEADVQTVDFMSIDVEGHELAALQGVDLQRWKVGILIIEENRLFGDRKVRRHLRDAGYVRFFKTGVNDWYTHRSDPRFARRAGTMAHYRSVAKGTAALLRIQGGRLLKKIPGVEAAYRAIRRRGQG